MLIIKRLAVWVLERSIEIVLGAYLLFNLFGTNGSSSHPGLLGDLYLNAIYVLFFYAASGFIVSTIYFGLWRRFTNPAIQSAALGGCFLAHLSLFTLLG